MPAFLHRHRLYGGPGEALEHAHKAHDADQRSHRIRLGNQEHADARAHRAHCGEEDSIRAIGQKAEGKLDDGVNHDPDGDHQANGHGGACQRRVLHQDREKDIGRADGDGREQPEGEDPQHARAPERLTQVGQRLDLFALRAASPRGEQPNGQPQGHRAQAAHQHERRLDANAVEKDAPYQRTRPQPAEDGHVEVGHVLPFAARRRDVGQIGGDDGDHHGGARAVDETHHRQVVRRTSGDVDERHGGVDRQARDDEPLPAVAV